jgi:dihydrofolate reductase
MRNIVARLCMSEDGIVERPEQWLADPAGSLGQVLSGAGTVVLGRQTFERYGGLLAASRQLVIGSRPVIARTGTEMLQGDTRRVLTALKSIPGEDLHVFGSLTLLRSLLRWRLVDEMSLLIHPIAAGRGTLLDRRPLRLISMCARENGVLEANYRVHYAATSSTAVISAGRWGGTRSRSRVASPVRTVVRTQA